MNFFNTFKEYLNTLIAWLDHGKCFTKLMKWAYYVMAVVTLLSSLGLTYRILSSMNFSGGWKSIAGSICVVIGFGILLIIGVGMFMYWVRRAKDVDTLVHESDKIVTFPLIANFIKNVGESFGIIVSAGGITVSLVVLIYGILSFEIFSEFSVYFFAFIGGVIGSILLGLFIVFINRFISEAIMISAQIANDLGQIKEMQKK